MPTDGSQSAAFQYRPQDVIQGNSAHAVEDNPAETVTRLTLGRTGSGERPAAVAVGRDGMARSGPK